MFYVGSIPFVPGGLLPGAILAAGPRGYWKLDEGAGTVAHDSSGFGHDGVYHGSVDLGSLPGPYGAYPDFAQNGSGVVIADDADWTPGPSDPITVVGLIAHSEQVGASTLLSMANKLGEWEATVSAGNTFAVRSNTAGAGTGYRLVEVTGIDVTDVDDRWYLLIIVLPQSDPLGVFIDGGDHSTDGAVLGPTGSPAVNQTTDLVLGRTTATTAGTKRHLAHVAVFRGALTTGQFDDIVDAAIADGWI